MEKVDLEIDQYEEKPTSANTTRRGLIGNRASSTNAPLRLESIIEEKKEQVVVNQADEENFDAEKFAIECQFLIKNAPDIEIASYRADHDRSVSVQRFSSLNAETISSQQ